MATTYKERLERGLKALGYSLDTADRSKYTAWVKPGTVGKLFVGNAGALRRGECASRSYSIGDPSRQTVIYKQVLDAGDPIHEFI